VTRQELFDLVWAEPMVAVAKRFDVSGSYLARVCTRLNVPRPARGYWAKLAVGKASVRPALPLARVGDEITWDPHGGLPKIASASSEPLDKTVAKERSRGAASSKRSHELIAGAKPLFLAGRESRWGSYLKPAKRLLPEIHVSKDALDSALALADALFLQLERMGHRVTLAPMREPIGRSTVDARDKPDQRNHTVDLWSPARSTVVYIGGTAIGIAIFELTEATQMRYVNGTYVRESDYVPPKSKWAQQSHWTTTHDVPCGRFLVVAYVGYYTKTWSQVWKEARRDEYVKNVSRLAKEIEGHQVDAVRAIQEGKDAAAAEDVRYAQMRKKWDEERQAQQIQKTLEESKSKIELVLSKFSERNRLEEFLRFAEIRMPTLDVEQQRKLADLIDRARTLYLNNDCLEEFLEWVPPIESKAPGNC